MDEHKVVALRERVNQMLDDLHQSMDKEDNDLRGSWNTELERSNHHRPLVYPRKMIRKAVQSYREKKYELKPFTVLFTVTVVTILVLKFCASG